MASFLQYTLPGAPSLYYGDEAGMEGYNDPFNRRTYPWGRENPELLSHHRNLGQLRKDRDQVWAEAKALWQLGEDLTLDGEQARAATAYQDSAQQDDNWRGIIAEWLERPLPADWAHMDMGDRRTWWEMSTPEGGTAGLVPRETVCVAEIWCEYFRRDKSDLDPLKSRRIGNILRALGEWEMIGVRPSGAYGGQKTFRRKPKKETG
jgi:hypothetical protein